MSGIAVKSAYRHQPLKTISGFRGFFLLRKFVRNRRRVQKRLPEHNPGASEKQKSELAGTRTLDHRLKRAMLYRLSYQPMGNMKHV